MNGKERFLAALNLKPVDRVPVFDLEFNEESRIKVGRELGLDTPALKAYLDCSPKELAEYRRLMVEITKTLDIDAYTALFTAAGARIDGRPGFFMDDFGVVYRESEHGDAFPVEGPIDIDGNIKNLKIPKIKAACYSDLIEAKSMLPDRAMVYAIPGPFKTSWACVGKMEELLLAYYANPSLCQELSRVITDFLLELVTGAIENGADAILLDGDISYAKTTLMSPDHYRKFIKPYHAEIIELSHNLGKPIFKHSDGNFWPVIDDLLEIGIDGLHPIQPQCMDIGEVKKHIQGKACLLGNIDCAELLPFGTPDEVEQTVKETIEIAGKGGGYILSSSNSIHPACDPANVVRMFQAAVKYGGTHKFDDF
jgi:uroporphyrinogen decarboxylase